MKKSNQKAVAARSIGTVCRLTVLSFVLMLFVICFSGAALALPDVSWSTEPAMNLGPRNALVSEQVNGSIYVFGGLDQNPTNGSSPYDRVEVYDTALHQWTTKQQMNLPLGFRASAVVNRQGTKIYLIGGHDGANFFGRVEEYDPVQNTWLSRHQLNFCRGPVAAGDIVVNNKIYAFGGLTNPGHIALNYVEQYDPSIDQVQSGLAMPTARGGAMAGTANNPNTRIYVIGGESTSRQFLNTVEEYNPSTNMWRTRAPMPTARSFGIARSYNNRIYVVGGETALGSTDVVEVYDPVANTWTSCPSFMLAPRERFAMSLVGSRLYAIGGARGTTVVADNDEGVIVSSYTPPGNSITVSPISTITLQFTSVSTAGDTSAAQISSPQPPPGNFAFLGNVYDVSTTGVYTGPITVTFTYGSLPPGVNPNTLQLLHWNGSGWDDVTNVNGIDTINNTVTGQVNTLSPFVLVYPAAPSTPPISTGYNTYWLAIFAAGLMLTGIMIMRRRSVA